MLASAPRGASSLLAAALLAMVASSTAIPTSLSKGHVALTPEAAKDEIHSLPGLPAGVTFRQFSGETLSLLLCGTAQRTLSASWDRWKGGKARYIDVGKGRSLFYWC
ncbi:hypothetical protein T484DRAFT_1844494 [Baffinella frigidus]|nr:hypothetical protein T484DRAFT_1844494 [Cryptophyta sp. CCMP2293]